MSLAPPHTPATGEIAFTATRVLGGQTATGIEVPEDVVEQLGAGRRPPVRVTLDGHTDRSTIAPMRGRYMLPVSAEVRQSEHVGAGDRISVEGAKTDETRRRRIAKAVATLREERT